MASALDKYQAITQGYLVDKMLSAVDDSFDKRQGSVIYDAISCVAVAGYDFLHDYFPSIYDAARLTTASGDDLDDWAAMFGIEREAATYTYWNISITNEYGVAGDITIGERMVAHDDDSVWYYVGGSVAVSGTIGDKSAFGILEPDSEFDNITRVEFTTISSAGREEESDASLRRRIMRAIQGAYGGSINDYVNLVLHDFQTDHPEFPPFTGVFIFPVQRRAGYVKIFPYWSNKQTARNNAQYRNALIALKDYLDPLNTEGRGCGKAPIGHRIITLNNQLGDTPHYMGYRVWINDRTSPKREATPEEEQELADIINEYLQLETNTAAFTRDSSPTRESNTYRIRIRTSNIITALDKYRQRHPGIESFQLDIKRHAGWVETSDDAQDCILIPKGSFRLPYVGTRADPEAVRLNRYLMAYHGNRDEQ